MLDPQTKFVLKLAAYIRSKIWFLTYSYELKVFYCWSSVLHSLSSVTVFVVSLAYWMQNFFCPPRKTNLCCLESRMFQTLSTSMLRKHIFHKWHVQKIQWSCVFEISHQGRYKHSGNEYFCKLLSHHLPHRIVWTTIPCDTLGLVSLESNFSQSRPVNFHCMSLCFLHWIFLKQVSCLRHDWTD